MARKVSGLSRNGPQGRLPGANKFCSWASENGILVVPWASEISLSNLVNDTFQ